jgi:hypothetical protein
MTISKHIEYYDYLNNDIIRKLNLSTLNKITPYNNNYIINLPNIPEYFNKESNNLNNYENNKISKLTKKDLIKIYDLNFKIKWRISNCKINSTTLSSMLAAPTSNTTGIWNTRDTTHKTKS